MKIALFSSLYPPVVVGGAEIVVQTLAEGFVERGHQVSVLTLAHDGLPTSDCINGVNIQRIQHTDSYILNKGNHSSIYKMVWHLVDSYNPFVVHDVKKWLSMVQPDIVNTHVISGFSVSIWNITKKLGIPLIHTLHDQYVLCPRTIMFNDGQNCQQQCLRCKFYSIPKLKAVRYIDTLVGVSQFIIDRHLNYPAFSHIREIVINNGIKPPVPTSNKRQSDGRRNGRLRFGYLGKINESKGISKLIDDFLLINPSLAELWIAGKGSTLYEEELKDRTKSRANISWLGFVKPHELLENIDVLVVPSLWNDSAPVVILEAFSFGVPVIGSKRGGIPEFVSQQAGWIFDPDQPGNLKKCLEEVIEYQDELSSYRNNVLNYVKTFYVENMISEYENLYKKLHQEEV